MTDADSGVIEASPTWGPKECTGALSLTFDNLGEAAVLQKGESVSADFLWRHPTAAFVPRLLDLVLDVPCTYFIEAFNTRPYPTQILAWHEAGKEVAIHAWQHEPWARLDALDRKRLLRQSIDAFATLGLHPRGFRPPGGVLPAEALAEFREAGLTYCSPLGKLGASTWQEGISVLPFIWPHVDAFALDPALTALRDRFGEPPSPKTLVQWEGFLNDAVQYALNNRSHVTVILHPYLLVTSQGMRDVLQRFVHSVQSAPSIWVASCSDVADWLREDGAKAPGGLP